MTPFIALAAALAPALPIPMVAVRELAKIRDLWLRGVLGLGTLWLAFHEPWLACMALWYLLRWKSMDQHPGLLTWVGIGATWFLLRAIPAWAFDYIVWGWLLVAAVHVGRCVYISARMPSPYERRPLGGWWRSKAWQGSPAITALFFALVSPFCPWWGWPALAAGLYLTWSWNAFLGVAVGLAVLYPAWALPVFGVLGAVLAVWFVTWRRGIKAFEWTPRGDSFDSVINRLIVWWLIVRAWWNGPRWLGRGAYSLEQELRRWSSRCWIEVPNGEACCDPLQHLFERGVLGVLAAAAFALRMAGAVESGDPWTAALAAGVAMAWGHYPFRQPAIGLMILTCAAGVLR